MAMRTGRLHREGRRARVHLPALGVDRHLHLVRPYTPVDSPSSLTPFLHSFSHNRVSCPPPAWIRTAHSHGVKMLGTLIFEWDAGREDIVELVSPSSSFSSSSSSTSTSTSTDVSVAAERFSRISTRYADYLVDLAVERGFEGWFINVEVDLGMGERKEFAREHAAALVEWVRYLRVKMHERIEGAEVMWYVFFLSSSMEREY